MKGYKLFILSILWFVFFNKVKAQDLIYNGSFEKLLKCPKREGEISVADGWSTPCYGTPDVFSSCGEGGAYAPENTFGYQYAYYSGNNYAGAFFYFKGAGDVLITKLLDSLKSSQRYLLKMQLSLCDECKTTTSSIGAHFSKGQITMKKHSEVLFEKYKPQVENTDTNFITEKNGWQELSLEYKANGGERYLTLAGFKSLDQMKVLSLQKGKVIKNKKLIKESKNNQINKYGVTYLYIDNIELYPIDSNGEKIYIHDIPDQEEVNLDTLKNKLEELKTMDSINLYTILFEPGKEEVMPRSYPVLEEIANFMLRNLFTKIKIRVHTDSIGGDTFNDALSENRAKNIAMYLLDKKVFYNRILWEGMGATVPIAKNATDEGRSLNRRVEIRITEK